jgi:hypothetical protein
MSRKKPAPDLIRGGHRFSDKDMRKIKESSELWPVCIGAAV